MKHHHPTDQTQVFDHEESNFRKGKHPDLKSFKKRFGTTKNLFQTSKILEDPKQAEEGTILSINKAFLDVQTRKLEGSVAPSSSAIVFQTANPVTRVILQSSS